MDEFEIIRHHFQKLSKNNPASKKLNDDVFFDKKNKLVISIDTYNEGVHFPDFKYPDLVIKKIIRSSISDLICKGVKPKYYFISGSGNKKSFTHKNLKLLTNSLKNEQKKYNIKLSGGDTTSSKNLSFSITSIGFSNKITQRNNAKTNDDIYITGNIGDSFLGLKLITNKIKLNNTIKKYFINKYYCPNIPYKISNYINKIANTSIDVSDGLISDMKRLINNQKLSFEIYLDKIPISQNLKKYLIINKKNKEQYLFNGDDYQILFTASKKNRKLIKKISNKMNHKITIIGKINNKFKNNVILTHDKMKILTKYQGYLHKF